MYNIYYDMYIYRRNDKKLAKKMEQTCLIFHSMKSGLSLSLSDGRVANYYFIPFSSEQYIGGGDSLSYISTHPTPCPPTDKWMAIFST